MLEGVPPEVTSERRLHRYLEKELNMEGRIYGVCSLSKNVKKPALLLLAVYTLCLKIKSPRIYNSKVQYATENLGLVPTDDLVFSLTSNLGTIFFCFRAFHPGLDISGIMYDLVHLDAETNETLEEMLEHIIELDDIKNGWASQAATKQKQEKPRNKVSFGHAAYAW